MAKNDQAVMVETGEILKKDSVGFAYDTPLNYVCKLCGAEYSEDGMRHLRNNFLGGCCKCGRLSFKTVVLK